MKNSYVIRLILFLTICLYSCSNILAQEAPPPHQYSLSAQIEEELKSGKLKPNRAAWEYTYIGAYLEAIETWTGFTEKRWNYDVLTEDQLNYFRQFEAVNAINYILERASHEQIVIFNEAHHIPMHRHFIKQLLSGFRELGFTHFGVEALANCRTLPPEFEKFCDSEINARGYPLNSPVSGTYTREPQMANLLRHAIQLDFTLFPYEKFGKDREVEQAKYIVNVLEQDPKAKILILCGFNHLVETNDEEAMVKGGNMMAYYLKQFSGIDPLTINQHILTEAKPGKEVSLYRLINEPVPSVFVDSTGTAFSGWKSENPFDVMVYHPRTKYVYNRPTWLTNDENSFAFILDQSQVKISYPVLIKAIKAEEEELAVPADIIEVQHVKEIGLLLLPDAGKYELYLENATGEKQRMSIMVEGK